MLHGGGNSGATGCRRLRPESSVCSSLAAFCGLLAVRGGRFLSVHTTHKTSVVRHSLQQKKLPYRTRRGYESYDTRGIKSACNIRKKVILYSRPAPTGILYLLAQRRPFCCCASCFFFFFFSFFFVSRVAKKKICRGDGTGARNVRLPTLRAGLLARAVRRR